MPAIWMVIRVLLSAAIIVAVGEISARFPRAGALLLSLPIVSILAILLGWHQHHELKPLSSLAKDTLILVPLGASLFCPSRVCPATLNRVLAGHDRGSRPGQCNDRDLSHNNWSRIAVFLRLWRLSFGTTKSAWLA